MITATIRPHIASVIYHVIGGRTGGAVEATYNIYTFGGLDLLSLTAFTGNIKIILAATVETGINANIITGRHGDFSASVNVTTTPTWVQYEADVTGITSILAAAFVGVVGAFALDDVWYNVDMGADTNADQQIYQSTATIESVVNAQWTDTTSPPPVWQPLQPFTWLINGDNLLFNGDQVVSAVGN